MFLLALRGDRANDVHDALLREGCITDVRGEVLRLGFGLYQDDDDIDQLAGLLKALG